MSVDTPVKEAPARTGLPTGEEAVGIAENWLRLKRKEQASRQTSHDDLPPSPPANDSGDNNGDNNPRGHMTWGMQMKESARDHDYSRVLGLLPVGAYRATFLRIGSAGRAVMEKRKSHTPYKETYKETLEEKRHHLDEATDTHQEAIRWAGRGMKLVGIGIVALTAGPQVAISR